MAHHGTNSKGYPPSPPPADERRPLVRSSPSSSQETWACTAALPALRSPPRPNPTPFRMKMPAYKTPAAPPSRPLFSLSPETPPGGRNLSSEFASPATVFCRFRRDLGTPPPHLAARAHLMYVHISVTSPPILFCNQSSTVMRTEDHRRLHRLQPCSPLTPG
jgi:hypothetical protein